MYLSFLNDCLIKGKAGLFDTIKKVNLDIEDNEKDSEISFSHERSYAGVWLNVGWKN